MLGEHEGHVPREGSSRALAAAVLGLGLLAYVLLLPGRTYGDDVYFVQCVVRDFPFSEHFFFLPLLRGTSWVLAHLGIDPFTTLRLLSALGVAGGSACLVLAGRARGLGNASALALAVLPLTATSMLFFGTAAEVHGLHYGAVGLLLWLVARLGPNREPRRVLLAALSFGLVVGTHKSGPLLLPALVAAYFGLTPGRARGARWRDAGSLVLGGALSLAAMALFRLLETGSPFSDADSPLRMIQAIRVKIARGHGLDDMLRVLARDFEPALPLLLAGAVAAGALLRRRPRLGLLFLLAFLPYCVFFPVFGYEEHGAYFLVTLPLHAAALVHAAPRMRGVAAAAGACALFAWATPAELHGLLGPFGAPAAHAAALALGLVLGGLRPRGLPERTALVPLAALALLQAVGAVRHLEAYDRERPLLDWLAAACRANGGRDTWLVVADFGRTWSLRLVDEPWPEPWAGTWPLLDEVPLPGPHSFEYGNPDLTGPALEETVAGLLAGGTEIWIDDSVRSFLALQPQHAGDLERLERTYDLEPVAQGPFHAERLVRRDP